MVCSEQGATQAVTVNEEQAKLDIFLFIFLDNTSFSTIFPSNARSGTC